MCIPLAKLLVRVTSGLSVLLLVASQEKVCPWLEEVPAAARRSAAGGQRSESGDDSGSREPPPPTLANTLPDVVAPRWPAGVPSAPIQLVRGKRARSTVSGRAGDQDTARGVWQLGVASAFSWSARRDSANEAWGAQAGGQLVFAHDPTGLTSISRTGPPVA